MISTTTLAKILNVSSAVILEHYNRYKNQLTRHSKKINNKRYYDAKAVAIIIKRIKINNFHKTKQFSLAKNLQIENKRQSKSIQQLHKLLNQQQELQLDSQQELKAIKQQLKLTNKNSSHGKIWKFFHNL